jgi:hypothetical protein
VNIQEWNNIAMGRGQGGEYEGNLLKQSEWSDLKQWEVCQEMSRCRWENDHCYFKMKRGYFKSHDVENDINGE